MPRRREAQVGGAGWARSRPETARFCYGPWRCFVSLPTVAVGVSHCLRVRDPFPA